MNTELLRKEINKTNASLFRVSFVKANGEHRTMYAKIGIKRFLSKKPNKKRKSCWLYCRLCWNNKAPC
jgi:hypothetical protein